MSSSLSISKHEFARRRQRLMESMEADSIAIVPSGREQTRSRDTHYPFRQDNDFYYLSGFDEPESVLVLIPGREHGSYVMFCRERDKTKEIWDGYRAGPEGVCQHPPTAGEHKPGTARNRCRIMRAA